jgi:16S rRNA (cytosine967-C5)-methyltransferase
VGVVCAPVSGESWWDACSGSGGKSLHLADLAHQELRILATDIRPTILRSLEERAAEAGVKKVIRTQLWDGDTQPPPPGPFNGVLLDVPCSGTGTWARNPDARWRLSPTEFARLNTLQRKLLHGAADSVKPGGTLVYATCSALASENETLIQEFLAANSAFQPAPVKHPLSGEPTPGIIRIQPWEGPCNAMFIATLRRAS